VLAPEVAHHLARVLRLGRGDRFVAFDPRAHREAEATIVRDVGDRVVVEVGPLSLAGLVMDRAVTWVQGLAKADKCDAIVRDATELGATCFSVALCLRGVVRLDATRAAPRRARWERIATQAARQCGRADPPEVLGPHAWADALAGVPPEAARFCLYESATEPLAPSLAEALASGPPLAFAVGPEGGLDASEVETAQSLGWRIVSLGPLILRTETVAAAVLGATRIWK
jgi:16S rRNA (uracil1498-N3)-methyltransferase